MKIKDIVLILIASVVVFYLGVILYKNIESMGLQLGNIAFLIPIFLILFIRRFFNKFREEILKED